MSYTVFFCPTCGKRRRITSTRQNGWKTYRCSQGHEWQVEMGTFEKITTVGMAALVPHLQELFTAESPFYRELKRR